VNTEGKLKSPIGIAVIWLAYKSRFTLGAEGNLNAPEGIVAILLKDNLMITEVEE